MNNAKTPKPQSAGLLRIPMTGVLIGYARVSTNAQDLNGREVKLSLGRSVHDHAVYRAINRSGDAE
ncbi:hypothetical protein QK290_09620 [Pseudarthrobacter sp. AL07]|uniref:hypothetical protein n=1 Tax=unclassified Pseudarthrobacter TaxID=2647000 RepID=UPI00249CF34E|nr:MULTISPECIES: hypothetical protein [unclassified Pseudarthrobacter]MDI3194689.1 hypothetical protein [Pseudarthrobacter sp. AL20]MDI3208756.1 hypothetical protein [Pseudarthrobacter sp. AL07]